MRRGFCGSAQEHERFGLRKGNLTMKTRKMRNLRKMFVAGAAAFLLMAESVTAFACPAVHEEPVAGCTEEGHDHEGCGEVILYDEQFVDAEGNIRPASLVNGRVFCLKHDKVPGYFQTHVKNADGGCTVKTYEGVTCIYCETIWLGDLYATSKYGKCPH